MTARKLAATWTFVFCLALALNGSVSELSAQEVAEDVEYVEDGPSSGFAYLAANGFSWFSGPPDWNFYDPPLLMHEGDTRFLRLLTSGRLWFDIDFLAWASKKAQLPPLVTTSPEGTSSGDAGVLGKDSTTILFGNSAIQDNLRCGLRVATGFWLTPEHLSGFEAVFLGLSGQKYTFDGYTNDHAIVARPYINANGGNDASQLFSYPNVWVGGIHAISSMQFTSMEALWRRVWQSDENSRYTWVAGYRYAHLTDWLEVDTTRTALSEVDGYLATDRVTSFDKFRSANDFHGGELGLLGHWWRGRWALQGWGKFAVGENFTEARVAGQTNAYQLNLGRYTLANSTAAGMLALPSNIGSYSQSELAFMTDLGIRVEYAFTPLCKASIGYSFIYWSNVARVYNSLDLTIDPQQLPPSTGAGTSPSFAFHNEGFWTQGLTVGIQYDF